MITQPILVTGTARSGTSMVARILHESGAWVGTTEPGSPENPNGFYENRYLRDGLVKTILAMVGADHLGVGPLPPRDLSTDIDIRPLVDRLLVDDGYAEIPNGPRWLYKDAKLLLMWRDWHRAYPSATWVMVHREREELIDACRRTTFMNTAKYGDRDHNFWEKWVDSYLERAEELKVSGAKVMVVDANALIDGDVSSLEEVINETGLKAPLGGIKSLIQPELWGGKKRRFVQKMGMNADTDHILNNIRTNIKRQLPQVKPYQENPQKIAIVAGGPSLNDTLPELRRQVEEEGYMLVAVNGTFDWLVERGFKPSVHAMVDARQFNTRFVQNPISTCKYLIASQCHPDVFDALKGQNVHIFHVLNEIGEKEILDDYYYGKYHFVVGGSTVVLRTIWMMRMLGFTKMDIHGFDSCYMNGNHHAYQQVENDDCEVREVECMGKKFQCAGWMASQYEDFQHFIASLGDKFELNVHGNGLIAYMMEEGAKLCDEKKSTVGGN